MTISRVRNSDLKINSAIGTPAVATTEKVSAVAITTEEDLIEAGEVVDSEIVSAATKETREIRGIRKLTSREAIRADSIMTTAAAAADSGAAAAVVADSAEEVAASVEVAVVTLIVAEAAVSIEIAEAVSTTEIAEEVLKIEIAVVSAGEEDSINPSDRVAVATLLRIRKLNLTIKL